ncbi:Steryl-sulfatase [Bacteroides coprosuis DSM 18011]|uniref:Steryl-sulfatase n=1 Tax=Bacteroides coprosuis DSM 18011 TaxID=679937 RepID=F3ZSJ6_9BACE|nr:arylsulfatase [Bacteroides coprosuis]EGJ72148.1 Steryl-sulfatase [Bacteroides coprosuis DSM 18011]
MKKIYPTLSLMAPLLAWSGKADGKVNKPRDEKKPNVIIIYADDLGYGDLGCYGAKNVVTPHIDKLAQNGVQFMNGHATAATSTPSRYSLLTGEYAWRKPGTDIAAGDAGMIIRPEQFTMADVFKSANYTTAAFGKWHLGLGDKSGEQDWNAPLAAHLGDLGFDYSYIMAATADRVPCVFIENGKVANYDPEHPIETSYEKPFPGEPLGSTHPELLYNQKSSYGHDMAIVNGIGRIGYMRGGGKALWKDENLADSITTHAIDFIKENKDNPFFIYFATNDVHVPRFPHDRFRGKNKMGVRGDAIAQFDWSVGEILKTLKELNLEENTLIILSSDNGPVIDDGYDDQAEELLHGHKPAGPFRGMKYSAFEGGTAVPVIVSWPKEIKKGKKSEALLSQIDLMASFATLVDTKIPRGFAPDSENRLDTWLGHNEIDRPYIIQQSANHTLSVRTKEWKYIEPNEGPKIVPWAPQAETGNLLEPQLYNMADDNSEQVNVATQHPEKVFELQNILRVERKK